MVVASPLDRAQETAEPIAAEHGVAVDVDDRLIEAANVFEGLTFGVVPVISRPALGVVSGMVGAGGNAGALVTNAAFFATVNEHRLAEETVQGVRSSQVPMTGVEPLFVTVAVQVPLLPGVAEPTSVG